MFTIGSELAGQANLIVQDKENVVTVSSNSQEQMESRRQTGWLAVVTVMLHSEEALDNSV